MEECKISDEFSWPDDVQAIIDLNRAIRVQTNLGLLRSRDDVIRYLERYGCFDIISVADSGMTVCARDEPDILITITGYYFSSSFNLSH